MATLEILRTGPLAVVQDLGRAGLAHIGVGRSGAADRRSHTLANRLVANPDDRATVEVTLGGFCARVRGGDVDVAVTGADTDPTVDGITFGTNSIQHVRDGQVISLGTPRAGLRTIWRCAAASRQSRAGFTQLRRDVCDRPVAAAGWRRGAVGEHTDDYPELEQAPVAAISGRIVELLVVPGGGPRANMRAATRSSVRMW